MNLFQPGFKWGLRVAMTLAMVALLITLLDIRHFIGHFRDLSWRWIGISAFAFAVEMECSAWKNAWVIGPATTVARQLRLNCVKVFVNQVLPGGLGGEAARMLGMSRDSGSLGRAVAAVLLDRLSGFYAQLAATAVSLGVLLGFAADATLRVLGVGAVLALLGTFALPILFHRALPMAARLARRLLGANLPGEGRDASEFDAAWREFMASPRRLAVLLLFSLGMQAALVALIVAAGRAVGAPVTLWQASPIMLLGALSSLAPITVGNLGVTEGAYALGFVFFGFRPEAGVAASLMMRLALLPAAVYGGWLSARVSLRAPAPTADG